MNNLIYALIIVPIILILATAIYNQFSANIDQGGWSSDANTTKTKIDTGTWSGFKLGSMLPFILIAMAIVTVILGAFKVFGGGI